MFAFTRYTKDIFEKQITTKHKQDAQGQQCADAHFDIEWTKCQKRITKVHHFTQDIKYFHLCNSNCGISFLPFFLVLGRSMGYEALFCSHNFFLPTRRFLSLSSRILCFIRCRFPYFLHILAKPSVRTRKILTNK